MKTLIMLMFLLLLLFLLLFLSLLIMITTIITIMSIDIYFILRVSDYDLRRCPSIFLASTGSLSHKTSGCIHEADYSGFAHKIGI